MQGVQYLIPSAGGLLPSRERDASTGRGILDMVYYYVQSEALDGVCFAMDDDTPG